MSTHFRSGITKVNLKTTYIHISTIQFAMKHIVATMIWSLENILFNTRYVVFPIYVPNNSIVICWFIFRFSPFYLFVDSCEITNKKSNLTNASNVSQNVRNLRNFYLGFCYICIQIESNSLYIDKFPCNIKQALGIYCKLLKPSFVMNMFCNSINIPQ